MAASIVNPWLWREVGEGILPLLSSIRRDNNIEGHLNVPLTSLPTPATRRHLLPRVEKWEGRPAAHSLPPPTAQQIESSNAAIRSPAPKEKISAATILLHPLQPHPMLLERCTTTVLPLHPITDFLPRLFEFVKLTTMADAGVVSPLDFSHGKLVICFHSIFYQIGLWNNVIWSLVVLSSFSQSISFYKEKEKLCMAYFNFKLN